MDDEKEKLEGEDFLLSILKDLQTVVEELEIFIKRRSDESDLQDTDYAKVTLWMKMLQAIIDDADESDVVDTLDLYPLDSESKEEKL